MKMASFEMFLNQIDALIVSSSDTRSLVLAIRQLVSSSLKDQQFRLDCVDHVLTTLESVGRGPRFPTVHHDEDLCYCVRIFHWPPGLSSPPHMHQHWTVTGVLHNRLEFRTYRKTEDRAAEFLSDRHYDARAGEVGYICTPCLHDVANLSRMHSMSLHVFNLPQEARRSADLLNNAQEFPAQDSAGSDLNHGASEEALTACAQMLAIHRDPRVPALMERIFDLGGLKARLECVKAMTLFDPIAAARKACELATQLPGPTQSRLERASKAILQHR